MLVQGPGKFWNFLGCDVEGGHNDDKNIISDFIYMYIYKKSLAVGICLGPHSNCCLSLCLNIAGVWRGPGKMLLGSWKSSGNFCNQKSWNPASWFLAQQMDILVWCAMQVICPGHQHDRPQHGQRVTVKCCGRLEDGTEIDQYDDLKLVLGDADFILGEAMLTWNLKELL